MGNIIDSPSLLQARASKLFPPPLRRGTKGVGSFSIARYFPVIASEQSKRGNPPRRHCEKIRNDFCGNPRFYLSLRDLRKSSRGNLCLFYGFPHSLTHNDKALGIQKTHPPQKSLNPIPTPQTPFVLRDGKCATINLKYGHITKSDFCKNT